MDLCPITLGHLKGTLKTNLSEPLFLGVSDTPFNTLIVTGMVSNKNVQKHNYYIEIMQQIAVTWTELYMRRQIH